MKIIGYDSDSVYQNPNEQRNASSRLTKVIDKIQAEKKHRKETDDRECHVYKVDGEKKYFRIYRELHEIKGFDVIYLGIGLEPPISVKNNKPKKVKPYRGNGMKTEKVVSSYYKGGMTCCYCNTMLTPDNCTREHVVPKRVGGKIILPCCQECNTEKGGLMLHSYIQFLCYKVFEDYQIVAFNINQIKIKNANEIAKRYDL